MKSVIIVLMVILLCGCATMRLDNTATPEQIQAAKEVDCDAARALAEQSDVMLVELNQAAVIDQEAVTYWTIAGSGAKMAIATACGVKEK